MKLSKLKLKECDFIFVELLIFRIVRFKVGLELY